jgi:Na+/H+-dicarboxylate symporter
LFPCPGDLFIRALKCVVLPLVFVNVIISVVDMMNLGKASAVGYKTIGLYLLTTIAACLFGIIATLIMKGSYEQKIFPESGPAFISLGCNADGAFLAEGDDGSLSCTSDYGVMDNINFLIDDISGTFVKKSGGARNDISLSDTVYDGVFMKLMTSNIVDAFASANFAGIIVFAIIFGCALSGVLNKMHTNGKDSSIVIKFLEEVDGVLLTMINWIIMATPCKFSIRAVVRTPTYAQSRSFFDFVLTILFCPLSIEQSPSFL